MLPYAYVLQETRFVVLRGMYFLLQETRDVVLHAMYFLQQTHGVECWLVETGRRSAPRLLKR